MSACSPDRGSSNPTFSFAGSALSRRGSAASASVPAAATPNAFGLRIP